MGSVGKWKKRGWSPYAPRSFRSPTGLFPLSPPSPGERPRPRQWHTHTHTRVPRDCRRPECAFVEGPRNARPLSPRAHRSQFSDPASRNSGRPRRPRPSRAGRQAARGRRDDASRRAKGEKSSGFAAPAGARNRGARKATPRGSGPGNAEARGCAPVVTTPRTTRGRTTATRSGRGKDSVRARSKGEMPVADATRPTARAEHFWRHAERGWRGRGAEARQRRRGK